MNTTNKNKNQTMADNVEKLVSPNVHFEIETNGGVTNPATTIDLDEFSDDDGDRFDKVRYLCFRIKDFSTLCCVTRTDLCLSHLSLGAFTCRYIENTTTTRRWSTGR